jgi:hypothetical protein
MRKHIIGAALGLALAAGGCAAAAPRGANTQLAGIKCQDVSDIERTVAGLYGPAELSDVKPLYRMQQVGRTQVRYAAGAKLYVPAQQGVTQGYLERVLTCHAASQGAGHPNDPLRVENLRDVDVLARGQQFVIEIEGANRTAGKAILQNAQALRDLSTQVDVRQLSSAPAAHNHL